MTLEKFLAEEEGDYELLPSDFNLKRELIKHKEIATYYYWFDNEEHPNVCNWIDIEGIGFGWLWFDNPLRRRLKILQHRAIRKYAEGLYTEAGSSEKFLLTNKNGVQSVIFQLNKEEIVQIYFSNERSANG